MINAECPGNLACQNERCRDPCPGSCGIHAICVVTNHAPHCTCENGYTGDPFVGCSLVPSEEIFIEISDSDAVSFLNRFKLKICKNLKEKLKVYFN